MKLFKSLLFMFLISFSTHSQNKEETENWINQNINDFPVSYGDNPINVEEQIYLEDDIYIFIIIGNVMMIIIIVGVGVEFF